MSSLRIAPVLAALAVLACGYRPVPESKTKDPAYAFPHDPHVEGDVACTECHGPIAKADRLEANVRHVQLPANISKNDVCSGCHDTDPAWKQPQRTREFRLSFSHADHLTRVQDCKKCHTALTNPGDTDPKTPPMATCTSCHNHQLDFAEARCTPCHVDLKGYLPRSAFNHTGDWLRAHGPLARPTAQTCAQCHDQTYCAECHASQTTAARPSIIYPEEVQRSFIHRGDYVSRHMVDASAQSGSCRRCHGSAFCESCHQANNVSSALRFTGDPRNPHPSGYVAREQHGHDARRDIAACAGCHDQRNARCTECHNSPGGVAGIGGNPHPRGWAKRHDRGEINDNAMCRACHTNG